MMLIAPAESVSVDACADHGQPPNGMAQPRHDHSAALPKFRLRAVFECDVHIIPQIRCPPHPPVGYTSQSRHRVPSPAARQFRHP